MGNKVPFGVFRCLYNNGDIKVCYSYNEALIFCADREKAGDFSAYIIKD